MGAEHRRLVIQDGPETQSEPRINYRVKRIHHLTFGFCHLIFAYVLFPNSKFLRIVRQPIVLMLLLRDIDSPGDIQLENFL